MLEKGHKPAPRDALLEAQGGCCFYCNKPFSKRTRRGCGRPTRDHLWPKWLGENLIGNKVYACMKCNQKKGSRLPTGGEVHKARRLYAKAGLRFREVE